MILQMIDEDEKLVNNVHTLGGNQEALALTEQKMWLNGLKKEMGIQFQEK